MMLHFNVISHWLNTYPEWSHEAGGHSLVGCNCSSMPNFISCWSQGMVLYLQPTGNDAWNYSMAFTSFTTLWYSLVQNIQFNVCCDLSNAPQINCYVNSVWPSDAIWWHVTGSTWAQIMACCLMAPSHYLNHVDLSSGRFSDWVQFCKIPQPVSHQSFKSAWKLLLSLNITI